MVNPVVSFQKTNFLRQIGADGFLNHFVKKLALPCSIPVTVDIGGTVELKVVLAVINLHCFPEFSARCREGL